MNTDQVSPNKENEVNSLSDNLNEPNNIYSKETVEDLSRGTLEIFEPHLLKLKSLLTELSEKQKVLVEQLHDENLKVARSLNSAEYNDMFRKIQENRDKLVHVKKEMKLLHDKCIKLKKRALRLQQTKEKDEALKMQQQQKEQDLIAK